MILRYQLCITPPKASLFSFVFQRISFVFQRYLLYYLFSMASIQFEGLEDSNLPKGLVTLLSKENFDVEASKNFLLHRILFYVHFLILIYILLNYRFLFIIFHYI